jgi:CheY-like chemotaxis protein
MHSRIYHGENGDDALDYLYQRGNLPDTDGREVLAEIKSNHQLKKIPVLILTTSADARDIENCYYMGANSYIRKAVDFTAFSKTIQKLDEYWFRTALLPQEQNNKRCHLSNNELLQ